VADRANKKATTVQTTLQARDEARQSGSP